MSSLKLNLPQGSVVRGELPQSMSDYLSADMLEIDLRDGTTIEVGWHPEDDPAGAFRLVVFRARWECQVESPRLYRTLESIRAAIENVAWLRCNEFDRGAKVIA